MMRSVRADEVGLRPAAETAEHERTRLAGRTGRPLAGAIAAAAVRRVRYIGSEDAARNGLRYQPVAWTLIALVAISFFWPGRPDRSEPAATTTAPVAFAPATTTTTVAPSVSTPTTLPSPALSPPPAATSATTIAPPLATTSTTAVATAPLSVRGFGWASSLNGSPVSAAGVPEGSMPIANRLGNLDKASFVRLSGTETTLTLEEDADGAREAVGAASVVACAILDAGWAEAPDQSLDDAPGWDTARCVNGEEDDGTWTFDLSGFDDRAGDLGFALVPSSDAPADFQITFLPQ